MKPMTMLLVAGGFVAGLCLGMSGPLAKAGNGLTRIWTEAAPPASHLVHITASNDPQRDGFQAADFRWSARRQISETLICTPKEDVAHIALPGIQHL